MIEPSKIIVASSVSLVFLCLAATPTPMMLYEQALVLRDCTFCLGAEVVTSVNPVNPNFEFDQDGAGGPLVIVEKNGKCKPHVPNEGDPDPPPECDPDENCKFKAHYQVGIAVANGGTPFYTNDTPPKLSSLVMGGTYHAMQESRPFESPCGTLKVEQVTFRRVSTGALLCVIDFKARCGACNTAAAY